MARLNSFTFNGKDFQMEDKQKLFCMHYVQNSFHGTKAAELAGYSAKTATSIASGLLAKPNILAYVNELKKDLAYCLGISALDIAMEYKKVGFGNIKRIFDDAGNLVQVQSLPDEEAAAIASIEVFEEYQGTGADRQYIGNTRKVKFYDKINALDKLARMIGADGIAKTETVIKLGKDRADESYV